MTPQTAAQIETGHQFWAAGVDTGGDVVTGTGQIKSNQIFILFKKMQNNKKYKELIQSLEQEHKGL